MALADRAPRAPRVLAWLLPLLLVGAVALAFAPAYSAEFVNYDDPENLTDNYAFRGLGAQHLEWMLRTGRMGHFQPLSWFSLGVDYVVWGRAADGTLAPAGFHATNVALHALAALLVFALARRLFELAGRSGQGVPWAALFAALVFAVHPLRVESVAWVTERRDVLSAPFFLLALLAWLRWGAAAPARELRTAPLAGAGACALLATLTALLTIERGMPGRLALSGWGVPGLACAGLLWAASVVLAARASPGARPRWMVLGALALFASLTAKAWGIVMPALLLVLDAWPLARARGAASPARAWGKLLLEKTPLLALTVVFGVLAAWAQASQIDTMKDLGDHTALERVAQGAFGLAFYPLKTLWPSGLAPIYDLPEELSLAKLRFGLPLLSVLLVTAGLFVARRRVPALLAAWCAFVVVVSPVLGVLQSGPQLVADRYTYLACIPFALLAGALLERGLSGSAARRTVFGSLALGAVLVLGALTTRQTRVWQDSQGLWEHTLAARPESPMAHLSLGTVRHLQAGRSSDPQRRRALLDEAMALFERGAQLEPMPRLYANMALVEGFLAELEPRQAQAHRMRAVQLSARSISLASEQGGVELELRLNHGVHLFNAGRVAEALEIFQIFVRLRPDHVQGRVRLAIALLASERPAEAVPHLEHALRLAPSEAGARALLADARARAGG